MKIISWILFLLTNKKEILAHQTIELYLTHSDDTYIIEGDVEGENCFILKIHMKEYTK